MKLLKADTIPTDLQNWLWRYSQGFEQGHNWSIARFTADHRFVLIREPGHMWFDNSGGHYGPANYSLVDTTAESSRSRSLGKALKEWEGRWNKKKLQEAEDFLKKYLTS